LWLDNLRQFYIKTKREARGGEQLQYLMLTDGKRMTLINTEDDRITATLINDDLWDAYHEPPVLRSND
jgi:hypothetical protein